MRGLDLGADDYLTKPFHLCELNARVRAVIRQRHFQGQHHIVFRDLLMWPKRNEILVRGEPLTLTGKAYDLLLYLLANPGRVPTREAIAEHLSGDEVDAADLLDFNYTHFKTCVRSSRSAGPTTLAKALYRAAVVQQRGLAKA